MTTSAPASASVCTMARPMPRDPPVTTATLPVRSCSAAKVVTSRSCHAPGLKTIIGFVPHRDDPPRRIEGGDQRLQPSEGAAWRGISRPSPSSRPAGLGRRVRPRGGRAARPAVARTCVFTPLDDRLRKVIDPLKQQVRDQGLWATHLGPELGGQGYGQLKLCADERDPRPLELGADRLRLPGPRHRQRRDHRPLRHARAEGALPAPAARRRDLLLLLDDRAARRRRPDDVHDPRRARRRRVGHQRLEVLLLQRRARRRSSSSWRSPTPT